MMIDKTDLDNRLFDGFADTSRRRYIYLCNMQTRVIRWSRNTVEDFGLQDEYIGDGGAAWSELIHPEDRELYLKDLREVFAGKKTNHNMDYRVRNKENEYVVCTCRGHVIKGENGEADLFMGSVENHSIMDNIDAITNLYNIYEFWQYIRNQADEKKKTTVIMLAINNFSEINDTYGYSFGNKVLREFGTKIQSIIKEKGMLYRMDGICFACCLEGYTQDEIQELYRKFQHEVKNNIYIDGIRMSVSISGGAVFYNEDYDEYSIQTSARYAMEQSKHKHHGELIFFDNSLLENSKQNLEFMNAIRNSIMEDCDGFYLCYQPIVDAKDEKVIGAEALLRWNKEPFGEVPPGVFIPWLENDPCFWELGNWILKRAMTEGKQLLEQYPDFLLNVNVAYPQLSHGSFRDSVKDILDSTGFPPQNLCLELTERCRQLEKEYLQEIIVYLKSLGIKIAIDDFGTGFSALNLLSELPVDTLKIDRGFIRDIETNFANQAIVEAVTGCAKKLDVHVCLEGLEDRQMIDFVKQYPVYSYQGYHFSKPIPMSQFVEKYM